jgi:hypothetical protein
MAVKPALASSGNPALEQKRERSFAEKIKLCPCKYTSGASFGGIRRTALEFGLFLTECVTCPDPASGLAN